MDKFVSHTGVGVPLRRSNVDTDQIIPAVYLKRVTKSGFEDGLFAAWRQDKDFVLNLDPYASGSVLVAGSDLVLVQAGNTRFGPCATMVSKWCWLPNLRIFFAVTAKKMAWSQG